MADARRKNGLLKSMYEQRLYICMYIYVHIKHHTDKSVHIYFFLNKRKNSKKFDSRDHY